MIWVDSVPAFGLAAVQGGTVLGDAPRLSMTAMHTTGPSLLPMAPHPRRTAVSSSQTSPAMRLHAKRPWPHQWPWPLCLMR